jgi:ubiquitin-protein ligase
MVCARETNNQAGSPYVGGTFVMSVEFALDYPFRAPQVCPTWSFIGKGANA